MQFSTIFSTLIIACVSLSSASTTSDQNDVETNHAEIVVSTDTDTTSRSTLRTVEHHGSQNTDVTTTQTLMKVLTVSIKLDSSNYSTNSPSSGHSLGPNTYIVSAHSSTDVVVTNSGTTHATNSAEAAASTSSKTHVSTAGAPNSGSLNAGVAVAVGAFIVYLL
ncbi:unnamed protein product [Ambrosiozyma monospora]|uniref:Unnamed protein product n=1 Tax=Ambrosiozyma monospora TaxID=43982 RepID=A0A9W6Z7G6_AMBMO|nr:unnamed protein product [Ambrosiozyma monospora]